MFTGIIEEVGEVIEVKQTDNSGQLTICASRVLEDLNLGDSIAINGVCLTVTSFYDDRFTADVMPVTLKKTNLGYLRQGSKVNLERALQLKSRLGGHLVSGHIDTLGMITGKTYEANAIILKIQVPELVQKLVIAEGSIAIDGVSLTVASLNPDGFKVSIIPHTAHNTILLSKKIGDSVNLETDLIGKYLYHFLQSSPELVEENKQRDLKNSMLNREFLVAQGFI